MKNWINNSTLQRAKDVTLERLREAKDESETLLQSGYDTIMNNRAGKSLKIYKLYPEAHMPTYGSEWSACFDLHASIREKDKITSFSLNNNVCTFYIDKGVFTLYPGRRALVPTGLIFDLDENQSIRIHPRSGTSVKQGVTLANCEGVIDADYVQQLYIPLFNMSDKPFEITDGMRLAQAEVVQNNRVRFEMVDEKPVTKTDRAGGFGSSGT